MSNLRLLVKSFVQSFSNFSSWSHPSRFWIAAHIQWCIATSAHSQAPAAFLASFSTSDFGNNPSNCPSKVLALHRHLFNSPSVRPLKWKMPIGLLAVFKLQLTRISPFLQYNQLEDLHTLGCFVCVICGFLLLKCYTKSKICRLYW